MCSATLDNLAINGIIDFDAESYIKGEPPRYAGNPRNSNYLPFEQPLYGPSAYPQLGAQLPNQPQYDQYMRDKPEKPVNWKEILTLGVFGAAVVALGIKFKDTIKKWFTPKSMLPPPPPPPPPKPKKGLAKLGGHIKDFFKSKAGKTTGIVGFALLGLYGLYTMVSNRKAHAPSPTQHH